MLKTKNLIPFYCALLLLCSCSIEKRKYMEGYHVEWHNKAQQEKRNSVEQIAQAGTNLSSENESMQDSTLKETTSEYLEQIAQNEAPKKNDTVRKQEKKQRHQTFSQGNSKRNLFSASVREIRNETKSTTGEWGKGIALFAFALTLLAVVLLIMAMFITEGWSALGYLALSLIIAAASFVFAIIAKIILNKNESATPWYLWLSLIVGGIAALLCIFIALG